MAQNGSISGSGMLLNPNKEQHGDHECYHAMLIGELKSSIATLTNEMEVVKKLVNDIKSENIGQEARINMARQTATAFEGAVSNIGATIEKLRSINDQRCGKVSKELADKLGELEKQLTTLKQSFEDLPAKIELMAHNKAQEAINNNKSILEKDFKGISTLFGVIFGIIAFIWKLDSILEQGHELIEAVQRMLL